MCSYFMSYNGMEKLYNSCLKTVPNMKCLKEKEDVNDDIIEFVTLSVPIFCLTRNVRLQFMKMQNY